MKLRVVHRTTYGYSEPVTTSHHEARLAPRATELQRVIAHELEIRPEPAVRKRHYDYFGNRTTHFALSEPHRALDVRATSIVEVTPVRLPDFGRSASWESVRDLLRTDRRRDGLDAYQMTFESPYVALSEGLRAYAAPSFTPDRPILEAVRDLTRRIHADFTYDPHATDVTTPLAQVLEQRHGVCQDFAHLMIGCLRAHGLAGRYVSGYLLSHPPPGKPKLVGADASHAWLATWVPHEGWIDFDPTNDIVPSDEHVTVAFGRDFADVAPVRGVILGGGYHSLGVAVDVDALPET